MDRRIEKEEGTCKVSASLCQSKTHTLSSFLDCRWLSSYVSHRRSFLLLGKQNKCKQDLTTLKLGRMLKVGKKRKEKLNTDFLCRVTLKPLKPTVPQRTQTFPSFKPRSEITCCHFSPISLLPYRVKPYLHSRKGALLSHIMITRFKGTAKTRPLTTSI